jgi:hypothetical protein
MKSLLTLLDSVIAESGDICSVDTSMDIKTVHTRFENKGLPFLTVDLPTYESGLLTSLDLGYVVPDAFPLWKKHLKSPVFLGGFMDLIFDRVTGVILDTPSSDAVRAIRQITLLFKKIELECSPSVTQAAFDRYIECDREVDEIDKGIRNGSIPTDDFSRLSSLVFSSVFLSADRDIRDFLLVPKHGPGATADGKKANAKFLFDTWSDRCEAVFPFWWYATPRGYSTDRYSQVSFLEPEAEIPVKVIAVPKTQVTPRIIAMEPSFMQYLQQGINSSLKRGIDRSFLYDFISTEYQEPNQLLAHVGSLDGSLATLDLSEASDRVPLALVEKLFAGFPHLLDAVLATRSTTALVPGHGVVPLAKFASMGSALCFPVEVMVFFIIILMGWERANNTRIRSTRDILRLRNQVRAYGDDLIVPVGIAADVVEALELFGSKVNTSKSFWTGRFRESCGKEYFQGDDVSIVRFRREIPLSRRNVSEVVSLVSFRNQLYFAGYWKTVKELDFMIESLIPFPAVSDTSEVLGRRSFLPILGDRVGGRYQRPLVRGAVVSYRFRSSQIDDDAALMKCLAFNESGDPRGPLNPVGTESNHLLVGGRPNASSIYIRWAPAS